MIVISTPRGSWALCKEFSSFSILIDVLNLCIDFPFLNSGLSLVRSSIQSEKKSFLKRF